MKIIKYMKFYYLLNSFNDGYQRNRIYNFFSLVENECDLVEIK